MLRLAPSLAVRARYGRAPTARPCRPLRRAPLRRALCGRGCSGDHPAGPCALSGSCESQPPHRARPGALGSPRESQPLHHATAITPPQHHLCEIAAATSRARPCALRTHWEPQPPDDTAPATPAITQTLRPRQPHQSQSPDDTPATAAITPAPANLCGLPRPICPDRPLRTGPSRAHPGPAAPSTSAQPDLCPPAPELSPASPPDRMRLPRIDRPLRTPPSPHPVAEQVATRPHPSERRPRHRPGPAQPWYPATIFVNAYFGCEIPLHSPPPEQSRLVAQKVNRPRWWLEA